MSKSKQTPAAPTTPLVVFRALCSLPPPLYEWVSKLVLLLAARARGEDTSEKTGGAR